MPGTVGTPGIARKALGRRLVAEHVEVFGGRTDERDAGCVARTGQRGVLGEKPVAGMNRVDARCCLATAIRLVDVEIRTDRFAAGFRPDEERFVGLEPMQREAILVAVDSDGAETELGGGSEAADGDLRAVGDEQFFMTDRFGGPTGVRRMNVTCDLTIKIFPSVSPPTDIVVIGAGIIGCATARAGIGASRRIGTWSTIAPRAWAPRRRPAGVLAP